MFEKNLPVLFVRIEGSVSTNITEFKTEIDSYVSSINKELVTDEDFGRAELDVKFCKKTEKQLINAREAALNQSMDIKSTMDMLNNMGENIRQVRLRLEKLVKREKENRKDAIISDGCDACLEHIKILNAELKGYCLPVNDYQILLRDAIKGMKTIESMQEAVDDVIIAYQKVNIEIYEAMNRNIEYLNKAKDNGYRFLFNDFERWVILDNNHVALMITNRISEHKKIEAEKEKQEEVRRLKAVDEAKEEAEMLAAVEIGKQIAKHKKDSEEAVRVAKEQAVIEERQRVDKTKIIADETLNENVCEKKSGITWNSVWKNDGWTCSIDSKDFVTIGKKEGRDVVYNYHEESILIKLDTLKKIYHMVLLKKDEKTT